MPTKTLTIAIDAMGGDHGPEVVIPGAALSLKRHPDIRYLLYGDRAQIEAQLESEPDLAAKSQIFHTDVAVSMDAKPSQALRRGRRVSSMWRAIQAVKDGDADTVVSAGNTGALMVMAKLCLKTLPGIQRPGMVAMWPTIGRETLVLDVGANVGASATQLVDFALMGSAMARVLFGVDRPSVGLLNIGVEEVKGLDEIKKAHVALKDSDLPIVYRGFVEGDAIGQGVADVIVTEGFTGNIALKTAEGTARQISTYLREALNRSLMARLGALLARRAFLALKEKMDPRNANGAVFLGLNGIVVKSHGGTDALGFANAVDLAYFMASSGVPKRISRDVERFHGALRKDVA